MADDGPDFSGMTSDNEESSPPDLGLGAGGDMKGLSDLVNSMASARAPQFQQATVDQSQQPSQVPQPGLPNIVQLIGGLINPQSPRFNPAGPSGQQGGRAQVFENFMGNFIYALGQGFANEGRGPGSFGRGLGAAATAPYQRDVQNFQLQQQAQENQARIQQQQAQTQQTQTQTGMMGQMVTMQTPSGPMTLPYSLAKEAIGPSISAGGRVTSANIAAKNKMDVETMKQNILNGTVSRVEPGKDADGNFGMMAYNRQGQPIGMLPGSVPPASFLPKTSSTVDIKEDANGAFNFIPKTSTTTPVIPGGAPGPGGALPGSLPGGATPAPKPAGPLPGSLRSGAGGARPVTNARPIPVAGGGTLQGKTAADVGRAFNPQDQSWYQTTRLEAATKGYQQFSKMGAGQIEDNRQLNNRLADVQQKISNYEQAMQQPISASDTYVLSKLMSDQKFEAAFKPFGVGVTIPTGFMTELDKMAQANGISKEAQTRMLAYANAREAMVGYQRVLSGSGRSNEKSLQLQLDVLPTPLMGQQYAANAFGQFKQNLQIAGQGLPKIPGITSGQDIQNQQTQQQSKGKWNAKSGRYE